MVVHLAPHRVDRVAVELENQPVGDGRDQVDVDVLRAVRRYVQVVRLGQRGDLHPLGYAAQYLGVGVQDGRCVVLGQVAEAVAGVLVFAGRDRNRGLFGQFARSLVVVGSDRFFEPEDVELLDTLGELDCFVRAIRAVGVDQQLDVRADRVADGLDAGDVLAHGHAADLHLYRASAHLDVGFHLFLELAQTFAVLVIATGDIRGHPVAEPAEEFVQRHACDLGANVPQSDIDGADRAGGESATADNLGHPHLVPQALDVDRILADQVVFQGFDGCLADQARAAEADTRDVFVGLDLDDAQARVGVGVLAITDRHPPRPAELFGGDARDLHKRLRRSFPIGCAARRILRFAAVGDSTPQGCRRLSPGKSPDLPAGGGENVPPEAERVWSGSR